jgi:hypothetical protein
MEDSGGIEKKEVAFPACAKHSQGLDSHGGMR